jgi:hypothetical protein
VASCPRRAWWKGRRPSSGACCACCRPRVRAWVHGPGLSRRLRTACASAPRCPAAPGAAGARPPRTAGRRAASARTPWRRCTRSTPSAGAGGERECGSGREGGKALSVTNVTLHVVVCIFCGVGGGERALREGRRESEFLHVPARAPCTAARGSGTGRGTGPTARRTPRTSSPRPSAGPRLTCPPAAARSAGRRDSSCPSSARPGGTFSGTARCLRAPAHHALPLEAAQGAGGDRSWSLSGSRC